MDASATFAWEIGDMKMHHTFGGAAPIGRGWMICNGSQITQASYDSIHGAGAWDRDGVANSPLASRYTPNLVNRYVVGTSATAQTGAGTITAVGNASHQVNVSHNHQWYDFIAANTTNQSYNAAGAAQGLTTVGSSAGHRGINIPWDSGHAVLNADQYTNPGGSTSQSVQPDSIEALYLVRVI